VRVQHDKRQQGLALLTITLVLIMVVLIAFTALTDSQREATSGGRSRANTRAVHAADAGIQLAISHLGESPPNLTAIDFALDNSTIQTRARTDVMATPLNQVGLGAVPEGYSVNVGAGAGYLNRIFELNVIATSNASTGEVEAKLSRLEAEGQGY